MSKKIKVKIIGAIFLGLHYSFEGFEFAGFLLAKYLVSNLRRLKVKTQIN